MLAIRTRRQDEANIDLLRERIATLTDLLDLADRDLIRWFERDHQFRRRLLLHLDAGRLAQARAMVKWRLHLEQEV